MSHHIFPVNLEITQKKIRVLLKFKSVVWVQYTSLIFVSLIFFLIHFACYFAICWQSSSMTDVALIDILQNILLKPVSVNFLWALGNLLIVEGLMWLCLMYIYPHLLSFYIWIHAHVLSTDVYFGNIESLFSTKQFHNHWHLCINRLCVFLVAALRLIVLEFPHLFP